MTPLLERLRKGERINRAEVIEALEKLEQLETRKHRPTTSAYHLQKLDEIGANVYPVPVPFILWDGKRVIQADAEREHDGLWLFNEKRSGKRQPNGVGADASPARHGVANELLEGLFTYLLNTK